uniref:Reverse transcriptase domain-containing protein n=1 Tax=Fagus sylvatica TaxID=28930 RepID=A0A2N9ETE7_FAGSY
MANLDMDASSNDELDLHAPLARHGPVLRANHADVAIQREYWNNYTIAYLLDYRKFSVRHLQHIIDSYPDLVIQMGQMLGVYERIDWDANIPLNIRFMRIRVRMNPWLPLIAGHTRTQCTYLMADVEQLIHRQRQRIQDELHVQYGFDPLEPHFVNELRAFYNRPQRWSTQIRFGPLSKDTGYRHRQHQQGGPSPPQPTMQKPTPPSHSPTVDTHNQTTTPPLQEHPQPVLTQPLWQPPANSNLHWVWIDGDGPFLTNALLDQPPVTDNLHGLNFEITFETNGLADETTKQSTTLVAQLEVHVDTEPNPDDSLEQRMNNVGFSFEAGDSSRTTQAPREEDSLELHLAQFHLETTKSLTWLNQAHTTLPNRTILINPRTSNLAPEIHRHLIWNELQTFGRQICQKWVCIGDFNQVLHESDKLTFKDNTMVGNLQLQQVLSALCLIPIDSKGLPFMWMNKRQGDEFVMEKLDQAFTNTEWLDHFPHSVVRNLPIIRSDHGPIILDIDYPQQFRHRPFRFEWMWTAHPDYAPLINSAWSKNHAGSYAYILGKKLASVRDEFRRWNKEVFGKVEREIEKKKEELKCIQENINFVDDVRRESEHREQLDQLLHREEILWSQKARKEWDLKEDRNTKYFQAIVRNIRRHNKIIQIKNEEDVWISDQAQIEHSFCTHFQKLYVDEPQYSADEIQFQLNCLQIPKLTDQQRCTLDQLVDDAEILPVVQQLGPLKAPGPDGIPAAFYKKFWPTVQHEILNMVKAFFHSDDSFLFLKNDTKSIMAIQSTLAWYCSLSGQSLNLDKSELYCSPNMPSQQKIKMAQDLGVKLVPQPSKYLGGQLQTASMLPSQWIYGLRIFLSSTLPHQNDNAITLSGKDMDCQIMFEGKQPNGGAGHKAQAGFCNTSLTLQGTLEEDPTQSTSSYVDPRHKLASSHHHSRRCTTA